MEQLILNWIELARISIEAKSIAEYPDCTPNHTTLKYSKGRKFYRLFTTNLYDDSFMGSAYAFVDFEGNIYKANSWKRPAKGIRGNINKADATKATPSTGWLYR